jgi:hypothetical protein
VSFRVELPTICSSPPPSCVFQQLVIHCSTWKFAFILP